MLKWLVMDKEDSAGGGLENIIEVTDHPFATIAGLYNKRYEKTYSVSRSNPIFQDENIDTFKTAEVQEKEHNLYRTHSISSGYGSSSASQELPGSKDASSGDHITNIYIGTNQDEDVSHYFVWHANENELETRKKQKFDKELILSERKKSSDQHKKRPSKLLLVANPMFVETIQIGRCVWRKSTGVEKSTLDSLVTTDLLFFTNYSTEALNSNGDTDEVADISDKGLEDMDKVIEQLTAAVMRSKGISSLTQAVARSKEGNARYAMGNSVAGKLRKQRHKKKGDTKERSDDDSDSSSQEEGISPDRNGKFPQQNYGLENFYNLHETMQPLSRQPDPHQPLYDKASQPSWYLARREGTLGTPTSFRSYQHKQHGDFISWGNRKEVFGKYQSGPGSNFTLDKAREVYLKKEEKKRNCCVLFCKSICFLLLLACFILVIVLVSVFISQGKTMFGPM